MKNLQEFLSDYQVSRNLIELIQSIANTGIELQQILRMSSVRHIPNQVASWNIHGEQQEQIDLLADQLFSQAMKRQPHVQAFASEVQDNFQTAQVDGEYLVCFDPLDGSSNIAVHGSIGTIFSILPTRSNQVSTEDFYQQGHQQCASGYLLYGSTIHLMLTTKQGTHLFYLDDKEQFILVKEHLKIPQHTNEVAINIAHLKYFKPSMRAYIQEVLQGKIGPRNKDFNMRWLGSMVGDIHRILLRGGMFSYPALSKNPEQPHKLRLMYEANPMALLIEQAGGTSHNHQQSILDIQPTSIHQRISVTMGSSYEVNYCLQSEKGSVQTSDFQEQTVV